MKKPVIFIIVWVMLGVFNWNVAMADLCGEFDWTKPRDHYGIGSLVAAAGPFATVALFFATNVYEHGFYYKE